jgi:ribosome modulation factor
MEVSGELHATVTLVMRTQPPVPIGQKARRGPTPSVGVDGKEKNPCPFQEWNTNSLVFQPIAQSLYWLSYTSSWIM